MFDHIEADEYTRLITVASILQLKSKLAVTNSDSIDRDVFVTWINTMYGIMTGEVIVQHLIQELLIKVDNDNTISLTEDGSDYIDYLTE